MEITQTDTLVFEYVPMPICDLSYRFIGRIRGPVDLVWEPGSVVFPAVIDSKLSLEESLGRYALERWRTMIKDNDGQLVEHLPWMAAIDKVEVVECEIVPKVR
jgi:hypothetical protein